MTLSADISVQSSRLRVQCLTIGRGILIISLGLGALLLLENFGPALVRPLTGPELGLRVINLVAPACYLAALWHMGQVLITFAREGRFMTTTTGILKVVGIALSVGAAFQVLLAPSLQALVAARPGYFIALDGADTALGVLGIGLWGTSRLFGRAARLERELEDII
jgi:hypothetical protein